MGVEFGREKFWAANRVHQMELTHSSYMKPDDKSDGCGDASSTGDRSGSNTSYLKLFESGFQNHQLEKISGIDHLKLDNTTESNEIDIANSSVVLERSSMVPDRMLERDSMEPETRIGINSSFDPIIHTSYDEGANADESQDYQGLIETSEPSIFMDVRQVWSNADTRVGFKIDYMISTSDELLEKAHSQVLICNFENGHLQYFHLIKLALKCLHLLIDKYERSLSRDQICTIYYKLATIYFYDTCNFEKAEYYIEKSIILANQNQLGEIQFHGEVLQSKILQRVNPNLILNYLDGKISQNLSCKPISDIFTLLKIENLLVSNKTNAFILLQKLIQSTTSVLKMYCMVLQISLHLYRGSPHKALLMFEEVDTYLNTNHKLPPQFEAMLLLTKFYLFVKLNDYEQSNTCMKKINSFILAQKQKKWESWRVDGMFILDIPLDTVSSVPLQISWLSSEEFVIMYYFITGLCLLFESNKNKSKKVFDKAITTIDTQLLQLTGSDTNCRNLSVDQLSKKIIKLRFIKFSVNYYQVWLNFLNNDFTSINYLNEFMLQYNNQKFSDEELTYFKLMLPRVFYLMGIYYHFHGDIQAAKYYYYKVINLTSQFESKNHQESSQLQFQMGIGCDNFAPELEYSELHIYSAIHLLILNEYEQAEVSKSNIENKLNYHHKLNHELHGKLAAAFKLKNSSNDLSENFCGSDQLLGLTFQILKNAYTTVNTDDSQNLTSSLIKSLDQKFSYPFVYKLLLYVSYSNTNDIEKKTKLFQNCLEAVSEPTTYDIDGTINVLILRSLINKFKSNGVSDEANMAELKLQSYAKGLCKKFDFLSQNVDRN